MKFLGLILVGSASFVFTAILYRYTLAKSLIDIPNERSSHSEPTPRGGGLAIVLAFLVAMAVIAWQGWIEPEQFFGYLGAAGFIALVGFLDDHSHIAASWRLLMHFIAASWGLVCLGGLPSLSLVGWSIELAWLGHILTAVYLVWLLNLYNFMDGIDGIASIEAITVCLSGAILYALSPVGNFIYIALLLVASVLGFLFWNFPKPKIFMGDVGSGFLGMVLGLLSIQAAWASPAFFWGWVILLGAFIVDATVTLVYRVLHGDKFYQAHRSHAYQHASRHYNSHIVVTLAFGLINICWLLPVAGGVVLGLIDGALGVIIAYTPLVWLAIRFRAGVSG